MEMINRAFEGADAFSKMMEKLREQPNQQAQHQKVTLNEDENSNLQRGFGGNRAERRAAEKSQRRSKAKV